MHKNSKNSQQSVSPIGFIRRDPYLNKNEIIAFQQKWQHEQDVHKWETKSLDSREGVGLITWPQNATWQEILRFLCKARRGDVTAANESETKLWNTKKKMLKLWNNKIPQ